MGGTILVTRLPVLLASSLSVHITELPRSVDQSLPLLNLSAAHSIPPSTRAPIHTYCRHCCLPLPLNYEFLLKEYFIYLF